MAKVKIDAKTALEDIRAGMSDSALMDKHKLSAMGLQSLFDKLLQAGVVSRSELDREDPVESEVGGHRDLQMSGLWHAPIYGI